MKNLNSLPLWRGKAYRGYTGYDNNRLTAFDIIKFECRELGNYYDYKHLNAKQILELKKYPASSIIWVTKTKKDAEYYGKVYEIDGDNARIIATDGDNGYLILQMKAR